MSAPRRWLDDGGALSAAERNVLLAGEQVVPPPELESSVLQALMGRLPPLALDSRATFDENSVSRSIVRHGTSFNIKAAITGAIASGLVLGGGLFLRGRPPGAAPVSVPSSIPVVLAPASASPPSPSPEVPSTAGSALSPDEDLRGSDGRRPEPRTGRAASGATRLPPAAARVESLSPLSRAGQSDEGPDAESRAVAKARTLLRAGNPSGALSLIEQVRTAYPNGLLVQEVEALAIEALLAKGEQAQARRRAGAFLEKYPNSPHVAAVRRALP